MEDTFLEKLYEEVILPNYAEINTSEIVWKDHGKIDLDAWAHYFEDKQGREYVLLFEDFPGSTYLNDGLTHEVVKYGKDDTIQINLTMPHKYVPNVTGSFTLFKEIRSTN